MNACCIFVDAHAAAPPYSAPVASFTPGDQVIENYELVLFEDTSTGNPTQWEWRINGAVFSIGKVAPYYFATVNFYDIMLTVTNAYGSSSVTHTTQVTPSA